MSLDEIAAIRQEPDPVQRGRLATELMTAYKLRSAELALIRRAAIEEARLRRDLTHSELAAALGISKGRLTQIRTALLRGQP